MCAAPLTALTPWWTANGDFGNACATGYNLTTAPLRARGGVVYYGAADSVCAVDASGIRTVASTVSGDVVGGIWLDNDRVIYADGVAVYAVPISGGDPAVLFSFPVDARPGQYDYDGTFFYWSSELIGISRRSLAADGVIETIPLDAFGGRQMRVIAGRMDSMGVDSVWRSPLAGGAAATIYVSMYGDLLASAGDFTYVRYASNSTTAGGLDDLAYDLGVIDSRGVVDRAWTGNVPRISPGTASAHGDTVYVGGRLHYHDNAVFVGVVAIAAGARSGQVIGCSPTQLAPNREWATVLDTAADDTGVYALVNRTDVVPTGYAIVRFPLP